MASDAGMKWTGVSTATQAAEASKNGRSEAGESEPAKPSLDVFADAVRPLSPAGPAR